MIRFWELTVSLQNPEKEKVGRWIPEKEDTVPDCFRVLIVVKLFFTRGIKIGALLWSNALGPVM